MSHHCSHFARIPVRAGFAALLGLASLGVPALPFAAAPPWPAIPKNAADSAPRNWRVTGRKYAASIANNCDMCARAMPNMRADGKRGAPMRRPWPITNRPAPTTNAGWSNGAKPFAAAKRANIAIARGESRPESPLTAAKCPLCKFFHPRYPQNSGIFQWATEKMKARS